MKKLIITAVVVAVLALGIYYYIANIRTPVVHADEATASKVQEVLFVNLDVRYPPTPKEVVRFFAEITRCLYNETYSDHDFTAMAEQLYTLYDEELKENNPWDDYLLALSVDIASQRRDEYNVSSYLVSNSTDVIYFSEDGRDYARLHCLFTLRQGTNLIPVDYQFLLRRDDGGRWRILGWQKDEPETT